MAATLSGTIQATASWQYQNALTGSLTSTNSGSFTFTGSITNGTGAAGTADLIYAVQGTIAGAGNTTIDLVSGVTDWFGTSIVMARLKFLFIKLTTDTTSTSLTVGNATNPINLFSAATTTVSIRNGGVFLMGDTGATGIPMTNGASDTLKLLNADATNTATYQVVAIGSSA